MPQLNESFALLMINYTHLNRSSRKSKMAATDAILKIYFVILLLTRKPTDMKPSFEVPWWLLD